jgi:hypothetical protein
MKSLHYVLDVLIVVALALMIWQNHYLRTRDAAIFDAYADELNRISGQRYACEKQLNACYMDLDAMELNGEDK